MPITCASRSFPLVLLVLSSTALAGWSKAGDSSAQFIGSGPAGFKITGKTQTVDVKDDGKALIITVSLKDLETGIGLRDRHMRDKYLEVDKFPDATLSVPLDALEVPADGQTVEAEAKGTFSLHGQTQEVAFTYKATNVKGTFTVEGQAPINFKAFGINVPSYMGITVKPDLTVTTRFVARNDSVRSSK